MVNMNKSNWTFGRILSTAVGVIVGLILLVIIPQLIVVVDAKEIVVVQSLSGNLSVYTDPGPKWQGMGRVTRYPRRVTFSFSHLKDEGKDVDQSIPTQFNDGGHGNISGTLQFEMPLQPERMIKLHKDYNGINAIEQGLIRPALQQAVYIVGPTMSSTESAAEKRPQIPAEIQDQMVNGSYMTRSVLQTVKDPITGQDKESNVLTIAVDDKGKPIRENESQITKYGIAIQQVAVTTIVYDDVVAKQIKQRQEAATAVQLAIANAKKAEQDAITTAKQGEANAAKAKWDQEVVNAKEIAEAEKKVKVADAALREADLFKKAEILRGEGEAAHKKLVMEADGQLDKRLDAVIKINQMYADAIKEAHPGAWSPSVVMGSAGQGNGGTNAASLVDLMTAKTAREVGLDLSVRAGQTATGAPAKK